MVRGWKTETVVVGGVEPEKLTLSTSYKTYSLKEVTGIIHRLRTGEQEAGMPKRKLKPVSRYILEELVHLYFLKDAKKGATLESITVKDTKPNGD